MFNWRKLLNSQEAKSTEILIHQHFHDDVKERESLWQHAVGIGSSREEGKKEKEDILENGLRKLEGEWDKEVEWAGEQEEESGENFEHFRADTTR